MDKEYPLKGTEPTIIANIRKIRKDIWSGDTGTVKAGDVRVAGIEAIRHGMLKDDGATVTDQWKALMALYATTDLHLQRLCGEDPNFMAGDWGIECLAYIAGNSTCGLPTATMTGAERGFTPDMLNKIDSFEETVTPDLYNIPVCPGPDGDEDDE